MRDLYSVLNLSRRASSKDIKAAYWALAKEFHPDVNAADKQAEQWIKAINHAYEILGNPDARAAYDLKLARQRAKARRSFWRSAATGAATFLLMVGGAISMAVMWKQHASRNKTEMLVAKAPAQERTTPRLARSEHAARGADPSEPVSAPLPGPSSSEPLASTSSEKSSTALTNREARTPGTPAPSSVVMERAPKEGGPSAEPSGPSRTDLSAGQPVPRAPLERPPPPRTEPANVVTPEVKAKPPAPTGTVDQRSSGEPPRRDGNRKAQIGRIIQKKSKKRPVEATVAVPDDQAQTVFSYGDVKVTATRSAHAPGNVTYRVDTPAGSVAITGAAE
jgi:curved DNA-binding protein CbpA